MLSSDILEQQFGPTKVKILFQDKKSRIIQTVVIKTRQVLETSWVLFNEKGVAAFPKVHAAVVTGSSMGKAFRAANVPFERKTQATTRMPLPPKLTQQFDNDQPAYVIDVIILVGKQKIEYCRILEVYSGTVNWPDSTSRPSPSIVAGINEFEQALTN